MAFSRRVFLASTSAFSLAACQNNSFSPLERAPSLSSKRTPLPMDAVRLKSSIFLRAVNRNMEYLLDTSADRLLHNFRTSASLDPKAEMYGGWEARGIAGHTLGHYLTACSLAYAQTGDERLLKRAAYVVDELKACQNAHGDGYVGGTTVERDGKIVDGKVIYEELRNGDIRTGGFDINGGWVPLYTWHKVQAGLTDAYRLAGIEDARTVLLDMADYLGTILETLDHEQMQRLLASEFGGLNEAYAELYALTNDKRWLHIAERLHHDSVLNPLKNGENPLPGLHANTQIPKIIGLARLYELTGNPNYKTTSTHFYDLVINHYSYVIGGNSEREHFGEPDKIASHLTDRTCEACNTYNMMKLARHLYGWSGDSTLFDFYERAHINHIMAHQHPDTGDFVYFMPLASGSKRIYSDPHDSFWCCVGSGMESHSKHGDSIYWERANTLFINLFIASNVDWASGGMKLAMDTEFPLSDEVRIEIDSAPNSPRSISLRLPKWCSNPTLSVNGKAADLNVLGGYTHINRVWKSGDAITLKLPMNLQVESPADANDMAAFLHGPLVLGANVGPSSQPYEKLAPALVGATPAIAAQKVSGTFATYLMATAVPNPLTLTPFFNQYDNRSAVYFPSFTPAEWTQKRATFEAEQMAAIALARRTLDTIHLGEMQPERDHNFRFNHADLIAFGGQTGRQAWWGIGNWMAFDMTVTDGPISLQVTYWGEEVNKNFVIKINGKHLIHETRATEPTASFQTVEYPIPAALTSGRDTIEVKFETKGSDAPVYTCKTLQARSQ